MKIIGNLDATGNIKLRGRVVDKLVVDGGFYSRSYGETAYKSDLGQDAGSIVQNFYGLVVKETNAPAFTRRGINVFNFDTNYFYLSQNTPNTDEVVVNLRESPRTKVLYRSGQRYLRNEPTQALVGLGVEHVFLKFVIPANTLPQKILRMTIQGYQPKTNASDSQNIFIKMNDTTIWSGSGSITAVTGPVTTRYLMHLAMTETTPSYLMMQMLTDKSNSTVGGQVGIGAWTTGTNAADGYVGTFHFTGIDPTIDQTFKFSFFDMSTGNDFYVMSAFVEEI